MAAVHTYEGAASTGEGILDPVAEALALARRLECLPRAKLLERLALARPQLGGNEHHQPRVQISLAAAEPGQAAALDADHLAARRPGGHLGRGRRAFERRDFDLAAQREQGERRRHL